MQYGKEVSKNDEHGSNFDAGGKQHRQDQDPPESITCKDGGIHATEVEDDGEYGKIEQSKTKQSLDNLESLISSYSINLITSGPIPNSAEFNAYPSYVQNKIIEWHDCEIKAFCSEESERQNRLVDAEIRTQTRNQWLSFIVDLVLILTPIVAFCITNNPKVFWAYTILGASIIGNVIININSKIKKNKTE